MRYILAVALSCLGTLSFGQQDNAKKLILSAPTYYITIRAQRSEPGEIHFQGASNLPPQSEIYLEVSTFYQGGWKEYSDDLCVRIAQDGFFEGDIHPKSNLKFDNNLVLRAVFETRLCHQPEDTIKVLGKHGEGLANVGDVRIPYTELSSRSRNPQLFQVSGWYYGLEAIDRVLTGGSWPSR